jgi:PAS domain S-box-containing protein
MRQRTQGRLQLSQEHGPLRSTSPSVARSLPRDSIQVPSEIIGKWQEMVDLLAEIMHVPSAAIMRVESPQIKVFVSSASKGNPCEPGAVDTGPYCSTVMKSRQPLRVPDARADEAWRLNPHVQSGMISYLGVPISWPDGEMFGTICVRDNKRNEYSEAYLKLLLHFRDVLQADLKSLAVLHGEIEAREARIRRLFDANIIGIFVWDVEGRILEANDAFLRIIGYDREDLVAGRVRWTDLTPLEWRDDTARRVTEVLSTGTAQPREKEYFRKDGSRVPVVIGGAMIGEEPRQGIAFVLDLSERKRAEQGLRASEARFRTFVDHATDAFILHSEDGTIIDANRQACESLGYSRDELIGMSPLDVDPDVDKAFLRSLWARLDTEEIISFESRHRRKDGTIFPVEIRLRAFQDGGRRLGLALIRDITERKRAEAEAREGEHRYREMQMELAHANRVATMGQLTASIAHEVKQPIAATVSNAQAALRWLGRQPPVLEEVRQALTSIAKDGIRAGDVVGRIRDLIKKAPPREDRLDVNRAIREVIELTRGEAFKNGVSVQTELVDGLPLIQGDRVQLQQVMLNLMINAVEAMSGVNHGPRELLISTGKSDTGGVCVAVRDSGPGLTPAALERLFEPFYTTKPRGLGLGLSICRSIIEAHGGRLWASANAPRGAVFQFMLPAHPTH